MRKHIFIVNLMSQSIELALFLRRLLSISMSFFLAPNLYQIIFISFFKLRFSLFLPLPFFLSGADDFGGDSDLPYSSRLLFACCLSRRLRLGCLMSDSSSIVESIWIIGLSYPSLFSEASG